TPPPAPTPPPPIISKETILQNLGTDEIVFACRQVGDDPHWYANFSYYAADTNRKAYRSQGRLCKLNVRTGEVKTLVDDPQGSVRDPQVHYDGQKILFSWRKANTDNYHLYEINTDGSNLKQLTDGPYDDLEPTYLPDGGLVFASSRCRRWVNCWLTQVAILHRSDADGSNIRPISANLEQENTPWLLPDGRILYQRWEYIDRSQVHYHHLWTTNPDGTGQMVWYGNLQAGTLMIDAKPVPNTGEVLAIFSPGHGSKEHAGAPTLVTPKSGPDDAGSAKTILQNNDYRDPYPLSPDLFMAAIQSRLQVFNRKGEVQEIYSLPEELSKQGVWLHEPRPIRPRPREVVISPRVDLEKPTGRFILTDAYKGRRMEGINRGEIKKLLLVESLPKQINYTGGMEPLSYGSTFTLERILGTVPVEPDGSASFDAPAVRSLFFIALDENDNSLKRMQSFTSVMPGETNSCVGCHEQRTRTATNTGHASLLALQREPSRIQPVEGIPDVFDFPRDIQPILDRHCVKCHSYEKREGGIALTGDRGPLYSHSYYNLFIRDQIADGRNQPTSNKPPRSIGATASPLMDKIGEPGRQTHHGVQLDPAERKTIRYWIETGGPYPGTYAALGSGMIGGYAENKIDRSDLEWPAVKAALDVVDRRCASCHTELRAIPKSPTDERSLPPWEARMGDPKQRYKFNRHIVYNLTRPEMSSLLLAPLASSTTGTLGVNAGYGLCMAKEEEKKPEDGKPAAEPAVPPRKPSSVFKDTRDPDYQKLLAAISETKQHLDALKRFDMPGFRPPAPYIRELKRYGILPPDRPDEAPIDCYKADRAYWDSFVWKPSSASKP
ncbi:MAG TPA: hypothetical protein PLA90_07405, partial [Candidatus Sumerlaeota bacterium]|nr:hypothetical protein [Candidatus Sumerlaeota bacterium]